MNGIIMLFVYAAIMILATVTMTKKEKNVVNFCVGSRSENWILSALSIAATWIWAPALFVSTEKAYSAGWTLPIVVRPDMTIIDGFHRWTVAGMEPLCSKLDGKVPVVIVEHKEHSEDIYGTVTHNRARGTHLLEPMKKIVKELMDEGKTVEEIGKQLGMRPEEIFRLSDFSKEDFLKMMTKGVTGYSKAEFITKI